MLFRKNPSLLLLLPFSNFSTLPTSLKWRNRIQNSRLVSQISSLLLQRKQWVPLLRSKPNLLSHVLNPNLFFQILTRTRSHPEISLDFFNWTRKSLGFHPDLRSHCRMIHILIDSDLPKPAKHLLDPILRSHPASAVLDSIYRVCRCGESLSRVLSFILEEYCCLGKVSDGLWTFGRMKVSGCRPSTRSFNVLLDVLMSSGEIRMAWCFYAVVVRSGAAPDSRTWSLLARLLCREGKLERAVDLLDLDVCNVKIYDFVIDCYCRKGDFAAAINLLNEMYHKNLRPGFSAYSSVLDGGCRFGDAGVVGSILKEMVVRGLLWTIPPLDYDLVIQMLCEFEKTYAAELFLERARNAKTALENGSFVCMLRALSKEGRVKEAMRVYGIMLEKGVTINPSCCDVFLKGICKGEPSEEGSEVLKDVIGRGFVPSGSDITIYIAAQCSKGRWEEATDLLNLVLEKGILPDPICCCSLVKYYCADRLVDSAIVLHDKMKKLGGALDVTSYNILLDALFLERRIEEATQVFDYMRERNVMNSVSFSIMISALCHEKELRKAMKLHDEMLKVGLKPDEVTYKRLISGFA